MNNKYVIKKNKVTRYEWNLKAQGLFYSSFAFISKLFKERERESEIDARFASKNTYSEK
jgi:hypothetical protein